jgi:arylsulfatase/uncharacterized sulfatase
MRTAIFAVLSLLLVAASAIAAEGPATAKKPNVVLILVDDAALMDFSAYGGEALTKNIDALSSSGVQFTSYHTSPLCSPSRAMLLTGIDNHRTGVATIEEVLPPELQGKPGYSLRLEPGVTTVATRLKQAGYRTYMTGKWHLGHDEGDLPNAHGFDRSFALDASGADNWEQKPYMPYYRDAPWFENGKPATLPKDFYSSKFMIDQMIDYMNEDKGAASPFFAYIAFQAVHIPVQSPREFTEHYKGRFDEGWEKLREARWQRAKDKGLIPHDAPLAAVPDTFRKWDALSADEKKIYAKSMEVYSGMLEAMDHHIGRLVEHLKATGEFENTLFIITSDNGPEPSDPVHATGMNIWMALNGYHWNEENFGEKGSLGFIGREWAQAVATPSRWFKFYTSEGGLRVPFIVAGPGIAAAKKTNAPAFVTDVAPTILDYAGVDQNAIEGAKPITGHTLKPILDGSSERARPADTAFGVEVAGNAALFKGDYKIVKNGPALGDSEWKLYNLAVDPGEANDLAKSEPERLTAMLADYDAYKKEMGVLDLPEGYSVQRQVEKNAIARQLGFYWWVLVILALLIAAAGYGAWRLIARLRGT